MKKIRISGVEQKHHEMLEELKVRKTQLAQKFNKNNVSNKVSIRDKVQKISKPTNACIKNKYQPKSEEKYIQPLKIVKLESIKWLEDRSTENFKQWGKRAKNRCRQGEIPSCQAKKMENNKH